jgi:hypothetical protein
MSLVHSQQAQARGQAGAQQVQTSQDGDLFPTVRVGNFNLRRSQNVFLNRSHRVQVFNSSTLPADALTNAGSFTDIRIQGADPLMSMTFRLTLANDDTKTAIANLVAENVLAFIDHIDVMGNNGSLVLERIDFDHQFLAFAEHDPDSYARIRCALQGGSTGATFGIPASGQITLYIPVFRSVLIQNELMSAGLVGPLVLRVWWRGLQWLNAGQILGALPPRVASFDLLCQTNNWDPSRAAQIGNRMMSGPRQDIRFAIPQFQRTIENLVGGQAFTLRLSGVQGLVTSMTVMIRDLTQSTYVVQPLRQLDLLDPAGASLLGGSYVDSLYASLIYGASQQIRFDSSGVTFNAFRIPISGVNVAHSELRGHVEAFIPMSGSHQLRFIPTVSGNLQVTIIYYSVGMLSIERGVLSTTQS